MKANIVAYATTYSQFRQLRMHKNGYVIRIVNKIMDVNYYVIQKITFIFSLPDMYLRMIMNDLIRKCRHVIFNTFWILRYAFLILSSNDYYNLLLQKPNMGTQLALHLCLVQVMAEVLKIRPLHQMIMSFQRPTIVEDWQDQRPWWFRLTTKMGLAGARIRWPLTANSIRLRRIIPIAY